MENANISETDINTKINHSKEYERVNKKIEGVLGNNSFKELLEKGKEISRMESCGELLSNPPKYGEMGADKIFACAKGIKHLDDGKWIIEVGSDDPTVVLDERWKNDLGVKDSLLVGDLRKGIGEKKFLFSGGCWVWVKQFGSTESQLVVMQRDSDAKVDPEHYTGPAGRSGEKLSETSVNETNEELMIFVKNKNGEIGLLSFYRNQSEIDRVKSQKLKQVEDIRKVWQDKFNDLKNESKREEIGQIIDCLIKIREEKDIITIDISKNKPESEKLEIIEMNVDGYFIDQVNGKAFMDTQNNTLEVREEIMIDLPEGVKLEKIIDGEVFAREVKLKNRSELENMKEEKLVPALKNYIEQLAA